MVTRSSTTTQQQAVDRVQARLPNIIAVSFPAGYQTLDSETLVTCDKGHQWKANLRWLLRSKSTGCTKCNFEALTIKPEDFAAQVTKALPHIALRTQYTTKRDKVTAHCRVHDVTWDVWPQMLLQARGCPKCGKESSRVANTKRTEEYRAKVQTFSPHIDIENYTHSNSPVNAHCNKCGHDWTPTAYTLYEHRCPKCAKKHHISVGEQQLLDYVRGCYGGEVISDYRPEGIKGYEADVFLPGLKIGFDYHGMYAHSEERHDSRYHLRKAEYFEARGERLIQILEQEWLARRDIVESIIQAKIGLSVCRIYPRQCEVINLDVGTKTAFLDANHLQGNDTCRLSYGLRTKAGDLVAVMTFAVPPLSGSNRESEWYLSRFAVLRNYSVPGGFSKLLQHFLRTVNPKSLATFADRRFTAKAENVYTKNGFELIHVTKPNYWYYRTGKVNQKFHRFGFRKSMLAHKLERFDPALSEHENMLAHGWLRIYDAGNLAYRYVFREMQ